MTDSERSDTLYDLLEVSPRASSLVIRAAYRCLAQQHHPDKNPDVVGAGGRLAYINQAYAVLSDPARRLRYDRTLGIISGQNERRGPGASTTDNFELHGSEHQTSRPFGFRPLV